MLKWIYLAPYGRTDKVDAHESKNQIGKYVEDIKNKINDGCFKEMEFTAGEIISIYYKTGIEYNLYEKIEKYREDGISIKSMDIYDINNLMNKINEKSKNYESEYLIKSYCKHINKRCKDFKKGLDKDYIDCNREEFRNKLYKLQRESCDEKHFFGVREGNNGNIEKIYIYKNLKTDGVFRKLDISKIGDSDIYKQVQLSFKDKKLIKVSYEYRYSKNEFEGDDKNISEDERDTFIKILADVLKSSEDDFKDGFKKGSKVGERKIKTIALFYKNLEQLTEENLKKYMEKLIEIKIF